MRELLVSENEKEQKLLKLLQKYFKGQNDSFLYKMLRKKNILLISIIRLKLKTIFYL